MRASSAQQAIDGGLTEPAEAGGDISLGPLQQQQPQELPAPSAHQPAQLLLAQQDPSTQQQLDAGGGAAGRAALPTAPREQLPSDAAVPGCP